MSHPPTASRDSVNGKVLGIFDESTHQSRNELLSVIQSFKSDWLEVSSQRLHPHEYYRKLLKASAILCPRGNGFDTHRVWESLYMGRVVVTLHSPIDEVFDSLPVIFLNAWDELPFAESFIRNAVINHQSGSILSEKLFLSYWLCKIGKAANRADEFCTKEGLRHILLSSN